jgi:hypothetical protein
MLYLVLGGIWFILTSIVGTLMYVTQVGPGEAASNLSKWATWIGIENPPEWLKAKSADRKVRRRAVMALAILLVFGGFLGGMVFDDYLRTISNGPPKNPNSWEPLSAREALALRDNWRNLEKLKLGVLCAVPACVELAETIFDTAHGLDWPAVYATSYFMDNGIQPGIEIWSYPAVNDKRDKIADAIEHATNGRLRISRHQWEEPLMKLPPEIENGINLVIGRLK